MLNFTRISVMSSVAAALLATTAHAADLDPVVIPAPDPIPVEHPTVSTGGWYIRGDVGYAMTDLRGAHYFQGSNGFVSDFLSAELDDTWMIGGGIGYNVRDYLRTDLTLDYIATSEFTGSTDGFTYVTSDTSHMRAMLLLANAYVDLGTYHGITPYVGAGIGGAHVRWSDLANTIPPGNVGAGTTIHAGQSEWRFAYALTAGASYCLTDTLEADANYRYTRIAGGDMFGYVNNGGPGYDKGVDLHQFRVGARYSLGGNNSRCAAKPVAYTPEPMPPMVYK